MKRLLTTVVATVLVSAAAKGESCSDQVDRLAADHGLAIENPSLPNAPNAQGEASKPLAESGGDGGVLPPPSAGDRMPTNPTIQNIPAPEKKAAKNSQVETLLQAAQADARRGDEAACRAKLSQAEGLLAALPDNAP